MSKPKATNATLTFPDTKVRCFKETGLPFWTAAVEIVGAWTRMVHGDNERQALTNLAMIVQADCEVLQGSLCRYENTIMWLDARLAELPEEGGS
jgi:hypothetical protein